MSTHIAITRSKCTFFSSCIRTTFEYQRELEYQFDFNLAMANNVVRVLLCALFCLLLASDNGVDSRTVRHWVTGTGCGISTAIR